MASSRSSAKNDMLEVRTLGNLEDVGFSDKKPAQSSVKTEKKRVKIVPKTLKVQMKPIKETPLLGEEEMPEQKTDVQKRRNSPGEMF